MSRTKLAFIVEGHCEHDIYPSIISKIIGPGFYPISNAKGIGNIIKNTDHELFTLIKLYKPIKIIITLDYREAKRSKQVENCIQLKELVKTNVDKFLDSQSNGSLTLPEEIAVVIVDKTFESWLCADYESLKQCTYIKNELINEEYENVDTEILNPTKWISCRLKKNIDLKSRAYRKKIFSHLRPEYAKNKSRSFNKFYKEIKNSIKQ